MSNYAKDHVCYVRVDNWHPRRLNELMNVNWWTRSRRKKFDAAILAAAVLGVDLPKAERPRRVSLEIVLGPRQRAGDPDAYWKSLLDGLVKCGALVDDSRTWCELGPVTFRRADRKATVIKIEDAQDRLRTPRRRKPKGVVHLAKGAVWKAERNIEKRGL